MTVYHHFWGRKLLRNPRQIGRKMATGQAVVVVVLVLATGVIGTLLFSHGRG